MKRNGITNCEFQCGDLNKIWELYNLFEQRESVDVLITDPNRPGLHPILKNWMLCLGARRIVYVSCNPTSLARDCAQLCETPLSENFDNDYNTSDVYKARLAKLKYTYKLSSLQLVDMFPHTTHIEAIAVLDRVPKEPKLRRDLPRRLPIPQ